MPELRAATKASAENTTVRPEPLRSIHESESELVAEDIVVRYGVRSATTSCRRKGNPRHAFMYGRT